MLVQRGLFLFEQVVMWEAEQQPVSNQRDDEQQMWRELVQHGLFLFEWVAMEGAEQQPVPNEQADDYKQGQEQQEQQVQVQVQVHSCFGKDHQIE